MAHDVVDELVEDDEDHEYWQPEPARAWRTDVTIIPVLEPSQRILLAELRQLLLLPRDARGSAVAAWRREWARVTRKGRR